MQSATNVREAAGQPPLVPCASSNDLLVVGALLVADCEVFLGQYSKEQRAGRHLCQISDRSLAGSVVEVCEHVIADYQVGRSIWFVVGH